VNRTQRALARANFIIDMVVQVRRSGWVRIDPYKVEHLSDPPESPFDEATRIYEEAAALREGRASRIEAPRTILDEVTKTCKRNNFNIVYDPKTGTYLITSPDPLVNCLRCGGQGRRQIMHFSFLQNNSITLEVCPDCQGTGKIDARIAKKPT